MAPSLRTPSSQVSKSKPQQQQQQSTLGRFGRVSKAAASTLGFKPNPKQAAALGEILQDTQLCDEKTTSKRKRDEREDSSSDEGLGRSPYFVEKVSQPKKPKLQLPTPASSSQPSSEGSASPTSPQPLARIEKLSITAEDDASPSRPSSAEGLPQPLKNLVAMHESFLKALSIHYAHNGPAAPAELTSLLRTVTCLWKKHRVSKEDIQRMLALYEVSADSGVLASNPIEHRASPFKLTMSGSGSSTRICVEYVGSGSSQGLMRSPFNEKCLQALFKADVTSIFLGSRWNSTTKLEFLRGPLCNFPLLSCSVGAQTAARQQIASARRNEILELSAKAQQRVQPKLPEPAGDVSEDQTATQIAEKVKSRTLSLFDRVKAKQLAKLSEGVATPESILRRHALGRIAEVVEILRMKQQQKMGAHFISTVHTSPSKVRSRVCFSMSQLIHEIKDSVAVPMADEEVKMCVKMLASELPGFWISVFEMGSGGNVVTSVVLNGQGMGGRDAQKMLEEKERRS